MTRSGSATSTSITNPLALSPTNRLSPAERKARNHVNQAGRLARIPSAEDPQVGDTLEKMMALIGPKRARSRKTVKRPRKDLLEQNKKSRVAGEYTQRVVLGPLRSNRPPIEGGEELSTTISTCSFLESGEIEETGTPLARIYSAGSNDEKDLFGSSKGFVWDVQNPFATPPNAALQQYIEAMRGGETIGPLDIAPMAPYTTDLEPSPSEEVPALYCNDSFDDVLRPAERAYLDFLIAQDEAEERPIEGRRPRRNAVCQSRNKMLNVLGVEARKAFDGQC